MRVGTLASAALLLAISISQGSVIQPNININFSGGRSAEPTGFPLAPTDLAGNPQIPGAFSANWNNLPGATGTGVALMDSSGTATAVQASYTTTLGTWSLPDNTAGANLSGGANPQMMRGYLDADANGASVTLTGLTSFLPQYKVVIYFDGDNGTAWRVGTYTITDGAANVLFTGSGEDSEGVNFNTGGGDAGNENPDGLFQLPIPGGAGNQMWPVIGGNNNEGNYLISDILSADTITITGVGTAGAGSTRRAPINGIQIIQIPEPASLGLLALGLPMLLKRRRR